ncbi:hypothetical protein [Phytoactinopolyspora mesophila]|uniref:Uncharacterized protein n=1 Tax=Phytoactinopolyspora mesophila TaxID=2650750 RepID=A0A7K3MA99_9ACTN|nr:hypothetical protein [Phytoactinopolyspora mesophila]NDL60235.1 hypothetical protein [Phytoactinopolyspora mesophila]
MSVSVYTLTTLMRANEQRRVVVSGIDLPQRHFWIFLLALPPSMAVTGIFWPLFGQLAVLAVPVVEAAAFGAFLGRSRRGLQLRVWQRLLDKRRSKSGRFLHCGVEVVLSECEWARIMSNAAPVTPRLLTAANSAEELGIAIEPAPLSAAEARRQSRMAKAEAAAVADRERDWDTAMPDTSLLELIEDDAPAVPTDGGVSQW